jgi:WD40 repeat protein
MSERQSQELPAVMPRPEVERRIDQFEQAWLDGRCPCIDDYLVEGDQRQAGLVELVHVDMEWRWKRGEAVALREYLERYPDLAADPAVLDELQAAEAALREHGTEVEAAHSMNAAGDTDPLATLAASPPQAAGAVPIMAGYEIQNELGRGAMGVVYRAWHVGLRRPVALKLLRHGMAGSEESDRLLAEAQAHARMHHPNIVQLYEMGHHNGQPYLAMELAEGGSLEQHLRNNPLAPQRAAELLRTLAGAVAYAHGQNVIHRDLKPSNVLLSFSREPLVSAGPALARGSRLNESEPKISDFGLAKKVDMAGQTATGSVLGTPSYMAPEQAAGRSKEIGPAADVYSLGAILYECLTGRPPFRAATVLETLDQVRSQEPVPPRRLQPRCPRDLETVCLKCLAKEPRRRYASAADLADDLGRFLEGRPVKARPTSALEQVIRWARRRPAVAGLLLLVLVVTVVGIAGITWQWRQTVAGLERAEQNLYAQRIALADREWLANRPDQTLRILAECPEGLRGWEWHYLQRLCRRARATWPVGASLNIAASADAVNPLLAAATADGKVLVRRADNDTVLHTFEGHGPALAFHPNGTQLASAAWKLGPVGELPARQETPITIWDVRTGKVARTLAGHQGTVFAIAFSADGARLASASLDTTALVWDLSTPEGRPITLAGHKGWVEGVAFSPDGSRVATAATDGTVRLWNTQTGVELLVLQDEKATGPGGRVIGDRGQPEGPRGQDRGQVGPGRGRGNEEAPSGQGVPLRGQLHRLASVSFAPDGERVATGRGRTIKVWDVRGRLLHTLHGHTDLVRAVCFHPRDNRLVSASYDQSIKVWDLGTGEELDTFRGHSDQVNALAFYASGRLASASWDGTVRLWDLEENREPLTLRGHRAAVKGLAFSPDGTTLATGGSEGYLHVWDLATGQARHTWHAQGPGINNVAFLGSSTEIAAACSDGSIRLHDLSAPADEKELEDHRGTVSQVAVSPDGRLLASAGDDNAVQLWERQGNGMALLEGHEGRVLSLAFLEGRRLASAGDDGNIILWDVQTRQRLATWSGHRGVRRLVASRDGTRLASAGADRTVRVWDTASGRAVVTLKGHTDTVTAVAFCHDGRRLATGSLDRTLRLWDARTGQELLSLRGHAGEVLALAFSPDGWQLAATTVEGTAHVWDATPSP